MSPLSRSRHWWCQAQRDPLGIEPLPKALGVQPISDEVRVVAIELLAKPVLDIVGPAASPTSAEVAD